ncbi:agmatinase [Candidatus Nomurabacteria bacterium RIFCSPLOWO2_01_FULL_39_17]|uniref:Agmatinase n=1 Tax=Candidatus Nomurabacteria bacterium RIFCSPLOWO2_01_FULL_39_17 TaxID=1801770 RepID=A0A1F6WWD6_9BACT|nr:MAG: agmatinase [Candidatus Nomurabacteria bacterium RIFCSPLOWO2_01_FULL_39_17]
MIDKVVNIKDMKKADVVILSAPYEGGVSFMGGTAKAPQKILHCLNNNLELFNVELHCEPAKILQTVHKEVLGLKKLIPEKAVKKINSEYQKLFNSKKLILILGGEHTVSIGALEAISKKENPKNITVLQIDAHQDLRDNNGDYSEKKDKYAHSCAIRRIHEFGFPIVQVGVRTYSKYEYKYWQKNKKTITVFEWNKNIIPVEKILKSIKTKKIYLTIDVDGFDPAYMPGTGTPVQGGLSWYYGIDLIKRAINTKELIGADIVEVSPMRDSVLTEYGAAQLVYNIITGKFRKKLK